MLSSTHTLCAAIMSRLIFPEWFRDASDIWDTRFCLMRPSRFLEGVFRVRIIPESGVVLLRLQLLELTEHCDFFEVTRCKFLLKPPKALAAV
ncbi:hypothetical protein YE21202_26731 [Yersinia enterocolitica (type O:9) str. YE212/02]|uniref:Uncharacterized protein n=1 Tax=Yersinia enterocolitica serotype O:8 / biotype 1B (strain NCTC 13174 / 8081) TaxID=393305 RepID=A1JNN5_YERE8|nr:hypothetical protein [Yersinia enterocolitica]CAL13171.1 hypothetical protein YE3136 [Yersinia enterocolitica subsp. enterocolitica 8081]CCV31458.1 hypothetical protein YE21202_26731 [Yersinia enterocolitica (type O:9) str. YE212/02]CCV39266.1 hypothetical protein YE5603_22531 [Yersinia enterocolitica (type O:9) str. YE56/03]CCV60652.1 hypothetical protein YE3094_11500 [Yersinia enterocolitica (type O:2) str. YE3094/96]